VAHGGGKRQFAGPEAAGGFEQRLAAMEIEPLAADEAVWRGRLGNLDVSVVPNCVLLDDDGVGAFGNGRAGEDADGLAGLDPMRPGAPGARLADERQFCRDPFDVGCAHRVAVHRRDVAGRLVASGLEVGGERPAQRLADGDPFARQRPHARQNARFRLLDRQESCHSAL
jgi:hypothetical protein